MARSVSTHQKSYRRWCHSRMLFQVILKIVISWCSCCFWDICKPLQFVRFVSIFLEKNIWGFLKLQCQVGNLCRLICWFWVFCCCQVCAKANNTSEVCHGYSKVFVLLAFIWIITHILKCYIIHHIWVEIFKFSYRFLVYQEALFQATWYLSFRHNS